MRRLVLVLLVAGAVVAGSLIGLRGRARAGTSARTGTSPNCGIEGSSYPQPPAGFDPVTATAAQLREYGFPPRPAGRPSSAAAGAWRYAMSHALYPDPPEQVCSIFTHRAPPSH
ncbi:MAG TPA: hypothetical protein VJP41_11430 [Gaiellaceae bacterium]|nr:hypothetical protein [Gaiellaceae bacterium]